MRKVKSSAPKKLAQSQADIKMLQKIKEENKELKDIISKNKDIFDSNVLPIDMSLFDHHIAFLFSSPLVRKGKGGLKTVDKIDYKSEIQEIQQNLIESGNQINYSFDVATNANVVRILSQSPVAIHFSCHGVRNTLEFLGSDYTFFKHNGDILLLEEQTGISEYLFEKTLKEYIKNCKQIPEIVYVSSC